MGFSTFTLLLYQLLHLLLSSHTISMSSSTLLNLPYTSWAVDSDPRLIILAINATYIPEPVGSDESPLVQVDGLWGPHEWIRHPQPFDSNAPWLAFICTPKVNQREDISLCPPHNDKGGE